MNDDGETEIVLLQSGYLMGGQLFIATVPRAARLHTANHADAPDSIRGATFERTDQHCEIFKLPLFKRVMRPV